MSSLADKLKHFKSTFDANTPTELLETINRSISLLQQQCIGDSCIQLEHKFPEFQLPNAKGQLVSSETLLNEHPLVVTFIRGGWCPYCMLEIQAWQQYYEASFQHFNIIAITPEIAEYALATSQDNAMRFPLLIDQNLRLANALGLVHTLDADMKDVLLKWDIDLHKRTCDERYSLPIPATFVIDQDRTVSRSCRIYIA